MTVATIRTGHLNGFLGITVDGDTIPWTSAQRDGLIQDALRQTWPDIGLRANGTVALDGTTDVYAFPAALTDGRISRIEIEGTSSGSTRKLDQVTNWELYDDTHVRIHPALATDASAVLRFFGFVPFASADPLDILARLEPVIAMRAAGLAYGVLGSQLVNYKRQQGLDNPRVVDYQTAVGLSAYWERRYFEQISKDPSALSNAPRRARR